MPSGVTRRQEPSIERTCSQGGATSALSSETKGSNVAPSSSEAGLDADA
jgi:hypothetical protein